MFSYPPSPISLAGDNLVSRALGFAYAIMSQQSGIGSGRMINDMLDPILRCLDSNEEKLQPLGRHLVGVGGDGDGALPADDGSGPLRVDGGSGKPSGGGGDGATALVNGVINADTNLTREDVLATISSGAIGAICNGDSVAISDGTSVTINGSNLDVDALRMDGDNGTDILLGNCTTMVLVGDDLGGAAIWRRPKHWQS
jgi:hypothetical protein